MTDAQIKSIVESIIPLDPTCEVNRSSQNVLRARLRSYIKDMVTAHPNLFPSGPFDPRESVVYEPGMKRK